MTPLLLVAIFSLLLLLGVNAGLLGIPVLVIIGSWFFKYAFARSLLQDFDRRYPDDPGRDVARKLSEELTY